MVLEEMSEELPATRHQLPVTKPEDDEISLLDLAIVLAKHKKLILGVPFAVAVVTAIVTLLMPNIYTGRAVIMPPQQQSSAAAAFLGQLGVLAGGAGAALGLKNPGDLYAGMLKSRTIADNLIQRFKLQELYGKDTKVETRKALANDTTISVGRDGLVTVEFEDKDPSRAADIANAYIEELDRLTQTIAITEAGQRRLYFEKQLKLSKEKLADAEVELKKTQEQTGMIRFEEQGKAIIEAIASLRAQVAAREVQLTAMRSFATERNPDIIRVQQELVGLRSELSKLEKRNTDVSGDIFVPTGNVPEVGLEYVRKFRDVKYQETLFELMAKQYEIARVDEAKDAAVIQVVDKAVLPDRKSKPRRALIVLVAGVVVGVLVLVWVFAKEGFEKARSDPVRAARIETLRTHLRAASWRPYS